MHTYGVFRTDDHPDWYDSKDLPVIVDEDRRWVTDLDPAFDLENASCEEDKTARSRR